MQVDAALEQFGFAMGPQRVSDLGGNDVGTKARIQLYKHAIRPDPYFVIADRLTELAGLQRLALGIQAFINVGVNMGVLPTKGLTLPFMSYGRSSLIVTLAWLGILLRVHHETVHGKRRSVRVERA